jgi:hypothetical protein
MIKIKCRNKVEVVGDTFVTTTAGGKTVWIEIFAKHKVMVPQAKLIVGDTNETLAWLEKIALDIKEAVRVIVLLDEARKEERKR